MPKQRQIKGASTVPEVALDDEVDLENEKQPQPYAPSGVDRPTVWVDQLPAWRRSLGFRTRNI
jgi:hypothetical protein